jgi:hypothetical protein
LKDWFPLLPSYGGFVQRLNRVADVFVPLIEQMQQDFPQAGVLKEIGAFPFFRSISDKQEERI